MRIVDKPSSRLFYQGFTHGTDEEIVALFEAMYGRKPTEIVRSPYTGSVILAGPVLDKQIQEMRKPHSRQHEIDEKAVETLYAGDRKGQGGLPMTAQVDFGKVGGVVTRVTVTVDRKVSNGNYGSNGAALVLEASVGKDANLDAVCDALDAYGKAFCARSLGAAIESVREKAPEPAAAPVVVPSPAHAAPAEEPTRTKIDDDGAEYEYVKVSGLTVQFTPTGKKVGKIKGGHYTKIGVTVWPEVALTVGVNLDELAAGDYQLPALAGKTAVCLMKISDKSGKPYPEKVVEFVE